VLYQEGLLQEWARPWPFDARTMGVAKGFAQRQTFRDEVSSNEINSRHQTVLSRLWTEIRTRHYSLHMKQAYVYWVRRFVTLQRLESPRELGPGAVKA